MKFIEGIVSAVQGNTKEKLNDPLIGSFIASFIVFNWKDVLVLIFGNAKNMFLLAILRYINLKSAVNPNWTGIFSRQSCTGIKVTACNTISMEWWGMLINSSRSKQEATHGTIQPLITIPSYFGLKKVKLFPFLQNHSHTNYC